MQTCKFTLKHYETMLKKAQKSGYEFVFFKEKLPKQYIILRHDVDYTPEWTINFAEIEAKLGIKATYFFQTSADTYNLSAIKNVKTIKKIKSLGHKIGLHVDLSHVNQKNIGLFCRKQKKLFKLITGKTPCKIVSIHCPPKNVLATSITGIIHAYQKQFFVNTKYLSDSQDWYEGCPCKLFEQKKYLKIQLLTHAYIWQKKTSGLIESMRNVVEFRKKELQEYMLMYHPTAKKNKNSFLNT